MDRMGAPPVQHRISCHQGIKGVEGGSRRRRGRGRLFATTVVGKCRCRRRRGRYDAVTLSHQAVQLGDEGTSGSSLLAGTSSLFVKAALLLMGSLPAGASCMLGKEQVKLFVASGVLRVNGIVDMPLGQGQTRPEGKAVGRVVLDNEGSEGVHYSHCDGICYSRCDGVHYSRRDGQRRH
jgi:hypothetical protein